MIDGNIKVRGVQNRTDDLDLWLVIGWDVIGWDNLSTAVKCLKQENWLDMIGRDNISRSRIWYVLIENDSKEPKAMLYLAFHDDATKPRTG